MTTDDINLISDRLATYLSKTISNRDCPFIADYKLRLEAASKHQPKLYTDIHSYLLSSTITRPSSIHRPIDPI